MNSPSSLRCPGEIFLAGPTAVGKSEVALALAERMGGEIISVDSMQVYRGLEIGTAKPSAAERARVAHHLIDVVDLTEPFDVARFVALAGEAREAILSRGKLPIFCGGTGLYFKAFLEGVGKAPPADAALRAELYKTALPELLAELEARDPDTYRRIDRKNPRRVIRAIEVIRLTGKPFSVQRAPWANPQEGKGKAAVVIGLTRPAANLHRRIEARVEAMFALGLVDETRELLRRGLAQNKSAMQALGYRQTVEHLEGARALAETIELVKLRTRQFAKRQMTWFRGQFPMRWIEIPEYEPVVSIAEKLAAATRYFRNSEFVPRCGMSPFGF